MAVIASNKDSVMVVSVQTGTTEEGSPILSRRTISNVKFSTENQDAYDVITALYELQDYPIISVRRDNRIDLTEE